MFATKLRIKRDPREEAHGLPPSDCVVNVAQRLILEVGDYVALTKLTVLRFFYLRRSTLSIERVLEGLIPLIRCAKACCVA